LPGFDLAGPPENARHAKTAFEAAAFARTQQSGRPAFLFADQPRPVVAGENNQRVPSQSFAA